MANKKNLSELIQESLDKKRPEKAINKQFTLFEIEIGTLTSCNSRFKSGGAYYSFHDADGNLHKVPKKALREEREHDVLKHIFLKE